MSPTPESGALRAARRAFGWSLTEAADRVVALATAKGVPVATARSLRSQISRWENGHAQPEPVYRALLAEVLGRSPTALGIAPPIGGKAAALDRLRAALAEASAVDGRAIALWRDQLASARLLDDELGTDAAAGIVLALLEHLDRLMIHMVGGSARTAVAEILSGAAALAGAHALDRGAHDRAWHHYEHARVIALAAGHPPAGAVAVAGLVDVLVDIGEADTALNLLADARSELASPADPRASHRPATDGPTVDRAVRVRLAAAAALAHAAAGHAADALAALAEAEHGLRPDARAASPVIIDRFQPDGPPIELADLDRWRGHALLLLHDAAAENALRRALAAGPRSIRQRAAVLADLAAAVADAHPAESAEHARQARHIALRIGSRRIAG